jgi:adenylyltransferase/sulfurtransferase
MRYTRHTILSEVGEQGQQKIKEAKVLIVGAGGLGSPVIQYLTAAGVGTIGIVDDDQVSVSNLQRQVLYNEKDIGKNKVEVAQKRINENNSQIKVHSYKVKFTNSNMLEIADNYDLIVDCTDNFDSRYVIDNCSKQLNIPMVHGSISEFKGQVSVFSYKGSKSYCDLFPNKPNEELIKSNGVIGVLPGIIGSIQAGEVLKIIVGYGEVMSNKLFLFNSKDLSSQVISF